MTRKPDHRMIPIVSQSVRALLILIGIGWAAQGQFVRDRQAVQGTKQQSTFETEHRKAQSENPPDLTFRLRLKTDKKQFRQGEIIPLELIFASSQPKAYRMDSASYDRSGRLNLDTFHLQPDDKATDPLYDHFHSGFGSIGGGLRGIPELTAEPFLISYELNEWFRFDRPGKYRLYLTSHRILRARPDDQPLTKKTALTSNIIEFEILPEDKAWAEREFQRAKQMIDDKDSPKLKRGACRILRFLGSEAAAREMIRRYGDEDAECSFDFYAGLFGSPHRELVLDEMEKQMAASAQPVTQNYLSLLSLLTLATRQPVPTGDAVDDDFWRKRLNSYSEIRKRFVEALAMSVGRKTGRARAVSIQTLVDEGWDRSQLSGLSAEAMTLLQDLPRARQRQMLESGWKQIASPQLLPLLRQWYEKPPEDDTDLRELALRRLYELAPEEGRNLMMSEMKSPKPREGIRILSLLPDEMIPELDGFFAEQFNKDEADWFIISGLIERYASPALSSQVRSFYEPKAGKWACSIQSNLLAYLLRVAPDTGMELLSRALQARSKDDTGCWANTLDEVAGLHNGPELEKVAVALLNDSDPQIVAQAITLLMSYGSAEAEKPLWERFKQWHDEWNERTGELEDNTRNELQPLAGRRLETAFWQALTRSPGWLADPEKLARVQQLCLTSSAKKEIDAAISKWSGEIPVAFTPGSDRWGYAEVAQYTLNSLEQLKRKLLQFPQKTVFKWQRSDPNLSRDEKENLFRELKSFLEEHGMKLNR